MPAAKDEWAARRIAQIFFIPQVFLVLGALLGLGFAALMPLNQVPDEWGHFVRAWQASSGQCVAGADSVVPASFARLLERYHPSLDHAPGPERRISESEWLSMLRAPLMPEQTAVLINRGANLYSCVPYLPAAAAIGATRALRLPIAIVYYAGRLANLALYLFLTWLALRLLPAFHLHLFALALLPMSLHQAASNSADAATLSVTFLYIAFVLRLALSPSAVCVTPREQAILAILVVALSLCKFNVWLVFLILVIPASRFGGSGARFGWFAFQLALACGAAGLWQYLNRANIELFRQSLEASDIHVDENLAFVRQHPAAFLDAVFRTLFDLRYFFRQSFIGSLGHLSISLPRWLIDGTSVLLFLIAFTQGASVRISRFARILCALIAAATTLSLFVLIFSFLAPQSLIRNDLLLGRGYVPGLQGRYFIPFALLAMLTIANRRLRLDPRWAAIVSSGWLALCGCAALETVRRVFYASGT